MNYNDLPKVNCEDCIWYKGKECRRESIKYLCIYHDGVQCSGYSSYEGLFAKAEERAESEYEKIEY